jgi:hypothetical protein
VGAFYEFGKRHAEHFTNIIPGFGDLLTYGNQDVSTALSDTETGETVHLCPISTDQPEKMMRVQNKKNTRQRVEERPIY